MTPGRVSPKQLREAVLPQRGVVDHAQALAILYLSGGLLAILGLLVPHWAGLDSRVIAACAAAAFLIGPPLLLLARRATPALLHVLLVAATGFVGVAIAFSGSAVASATYAMLYVWVAMYAFHAFSTRAAWLHVGVVAVTYAIALPQVSDDPIAASWLMVVGIVAVNGAVVGWLARRIERYYQQLFEGERALVRRLEEVDHLNEELVASVSHDLRSPLAAILGFVRVLRAYGDSIPVEDQQDFLARIEGQTERLSGLVGNLLLAAGFSQPDPAARTSVHAVVAEVVGVLRAGAARPLSPILVHAGRDVVVRVAQAPLAQIFHGLLSECLQVPAAAVQLDVEVVGGMARITIACRADDGERMAGSSAPRDAVARRLVEAHGGEVVASGGVGVAQLVLVLPLAYEQATQTPKMSAR